MESLLQAKLRSSSNGLKPTVTKVTQSDGKVLYFDSQGKNCVASEEKRTFGFVIDSKPDLSIGKVLDWLFVSSQDVPNDLSLIQSHGITHILSLLPGFSLNQLVKPLIKGHLVLDILDEESFKLSSSLVVEEAVNFILNTHQANQKNIILVHCNAGLSRGPSIIIYYLISNCSYTFDQAFELVKSVRPNIKPNQGFFKELKGLARPT